MSEAWFNVSHSETGCGQAKPLKVLGIATYIRFSELHVRCTQSGICLAGYTQNLLIGYKTKDATAASYTKYNNDNCAEH